MLQLAGGETGGELRHGDDVISHRRLAIPATNCGSARPSLSLRWVCAMTRTTDGDQGVQLV